MSGTFPSFIPRMTYLMPDIFNLGSYLVAMENMPGKKLSLWFLLLALLPGCDEDEPKDVTLMQVFIGSTQINLEPPGTSNVPADQSITLIFSSQVDQISASEAIGLENAIQQVPITLGFSENRVQIYPQGILESNTTYTVSISNALRSNDGGSFAGKAFQFATALKPLTVVGVEIAGVDNPNMNRVSGVRPQFNMFITFSEPIDQNTLSADLNGPGNPGVIASVSDDSKTVTFEATEILRDLRKYDFSIPTSLKGLNGQPFSGYSKTLYTGPDGIPDFPLISDDALLTLVQQQTFKYFWDFGHPASGMARERNSSGDVVTSGGSGFGIMAIIVGIERNFINRQEGIQRLDKILDFLESADRFHGVWPHWLNGNTGDVVPFSSDDNGGDLVETSFLMQGLITFRQYLDNSIPEEQTLISRINALWNTVEWDWYTRDGQKVLYWHWSPEKEWAMNHQIKGYNEALITYVLAASSAAHGIEADVYHEGWASNGGIVNGKSFYGTTLPVGFDFGGPLFFAHYSFLGLNPRNLSDNYAEYWTQNINHSLINHAHAVTNPKNFVGYSDANWGFTASDNHLGYSAHSPTNDLGVITPTAALSSFPYTPDESMNALKFFYYSLGDRLWGEYGFYDAFNVTEEWVASSYLAIDQGPIIVMIENYRTGILWDLFMSAPEVKTGLDKLGFSY